MKEQYCHAPGGWRTGYISITITYLPQSLRNQCTVEVWFFSKDVIHITATRHWLAYQPTYCVIFECCCQDNHTSAIIIYYYYYTAGNAPHVNRSEAMNRRWYARRTSSPHSGWLTTEKSKWSSYEIYFEILLSWHEMYVRLKKQQNIICAWFHCTKCKTIVVNSKCESLEL